MRDFAITLLFNTGKQGKKRKKEKKKEVKRAKLYRHGIKEQSNDLENNSNNHKLCQAELVLLPKKMSHGL